MELTTTQAHNAVFESIVHLAKHYAILIDPEADPVSVSVGGVPTLLAKEVLVGQKQKALNILWKLEPAARVRIAQEMQEDESQHAIERANSLCKYSFNWLKEPPVEEG